MKKVSEAPLGTVTLPTEVIVVPLIEEKVAPESTPLTKIFIPEVKVTLEPALLGTAVNEIEVPVEEALAKVDATGEVFTRNTDSLFNVTLVVPKVFGDDAVLGV